MTWWNSPDLVSFISTVSQVAGAILGLWIVIIGVRSSQLQDKQGQDTQKAIAQANEVAAKATERAAQADLKTAALYEKMQWRHIGQSERSKLVAALSGSFNAVDGAVVCVAVGDPEVAGYAFEILSVLQDAGIARADPHSKEISFANLTSEAIPVGIRLVFTEKDSPNFLKSVARVRSALTANEIKTTDSVQTGMKSDVLRIQVGYNPASVSELRNLSQDRQPLGNPQSF